MTGDLQTDVYRGKDLMEGGWLPGEDPGSFHGGMFMSLQFVTGNSGSGKTEYVYEKVIDASAKAPGRFFAVVVPEQFTMQTQKDIVMRHPDRGIRNIDVLSFARLAWRIFEELGVRTGVVLDDMGKNLILRKIAGERANELLTLRGNLKKPGYISEVKSVISEFFQYGVGFDELEKMMELEGESSALYWKIRDLRLVYADFVDRLGDTYVTGEELLEIFAGEVHRSKLLKDSVVVLDGFTGFTPVQLRVIRELFKVCRRVVVTVTIDAREDLYQIAEEHQLFALSKKTVRQLVREARAAGCDILPAHTLDGVPARRFLHNPELSFLEQNIFRRSEKTWDWDCRAVSVRQAADPKTEVRHLAGTILRLVRTKGLKYREIAVIAGDMAAYQNEVRRIFPEYGIPYFMDESRNILMNTFVEYIRSLLGLAEQDFSYESVFRFLRSGYGRLSMEEIDRLDNYVFATGIRGYKRWQEPMLHRIKGMEEEDLEAVNHSRVLLVEQVKELMVVLKQQKKTVRDVTGAIHAFLLQEEIQQKLKRQETYFRGEGMEALALEYAQVYRCVIDLFDRFVALLGDEPIGIREYRALFDAGLSEARIGIVPPGMDQVVVGDVERTRFGHLKCLFFLGANDCYIPGISDRGGLLSDRDRERFLAASVPLSPTRKEKIFIQKFYLYQMLTKPSAYLELSYSRTDADGKSLRPSYLIAHLLELFPRLAARRADAADGDLPEGTAFVETVRRLFRRAGEPGLSAGGVCPAAQGAGTAGESAAQGAGTADESAAQDAGTADESAAQGADAPGGAAPERLRALLIWYLRQEERRGLLYRLLEARSRQSRRAIGEGLAAALYSADGRFGATELENYAACAYGHFLGYGLHLSEREEYAFRAMDWGNVFHRALERYAKRLHAERKDWTDVAGELRESYLTECLKDSIADYGNSVLYSSKRNAYLIGRMQRILSRTVWALTEQLKRGAFSPTGYETPILHGKIDRVDLCEETDRVYVKVVDYKTGNRRLDLSDVYYGLQMQLVLYLCAAVGETKKQKTGKLIIPAGVFYYRIQDPVLDGDASGGALADARTGKMETGAEHETGAASEAGDAKADADALLEERRLSELKPNGLVNARPDVLERLDRTVRGGGTSVVLPIALNRDGSVSARSLQAVAPEDLSAVMAYMEGKQNELGQEILGGRIERAPYRKGKDTACAFCPYGRLCGFESGYAGDGYREMPNLDRQSALERMKEEYGDELDG